MNLFGRVTRTELYEVQQALNLLAAELKVLQGKAIADRALRSQLSSRIKAVEVLLQEPIQEEDLEQEQEDLFPTQNGAVDKPRDKRLEEERLRLGRG
jgi:hypothetical protein